MDNQPRWVDVDRWIELCGECVVDFAQAFQDRDLERMHSLNVSMLVLVEDLYLHQHKQPAERPVDMDGYKQKVGDDYAKLDTAYGKYKDELGDQALRIYRAEHSSEFKRIEDPKPDYLKSI